MISGGRRYAVPSPDVTVVDTTGAGDAFTAGFLCSYVRDGAVRRALAQGSIVAGGTLGRLGSA